MFANYNQKRFRLNIATRSFFTANVLWVTLNVHRAGSVGYTTMHTFRHAFASVAGELGYSEFTTSGILGHKSNTITSRYVHLVDKSLVDAANEVSRKIAVRSGVMESGCSS